MGLNRDAGKGPFVTQQEDEGNQTVRDAAGLPFCWVIAAECVGGDKAAAKARATRIAEALNVQEGHSKPIPFIDGDGNLRAPAGYGFVAKGEGCEMVPLISIVMAPAR